MTAIGICDDMIPFTEEMYRRLKQYADAHHCEFEIRIYNSPKELLDAFADGESVEILFLDIEMDGMDGIELGRVLREQERKLLIVYVSGYDQYLRQLFEIEPFGFVQKPVHDGELERILDRALRRLFSARRETFRFQYGKNVMNLLCRDIVYLESSGRRVLVHTETETYAYYDKLDHAQEQLESKGFVRIHKAYLINMEYLEAFQYEKAALRTGVILNISEKYRAAVRSRFWDYLKERDHE